MLPFSRPPTGALTCSAVLFDMDGVLVDSRPAVERTWRRWARRHDIDVEVLLRVAHGRRTSDTLREVAPSLDLAREVAWLDAAELEDREGLTAVPGAASLLTALGSQDWAVVTSAGRRLAELRLAGAGLPVPRTLVTSDDVTHGKPHPGGYLLAARRRGVPAVDCLVVEDTPFGIAAGRAAGARVIAVTTTHARDALSGAEVILPDLNGLRVHRTDGAITLAWG